MRMGLLLFSLIFFSCSKKTESVENETRTIKVEELQNDFKVPESLWKQMAGEDSAATKENQIIFVPLKVEMTEKNPRVLKGQKLVIELPRGGGEIDMAQWTGEENGTFYLKLSLLEVDKVEQSKAFFLSQTRRRKIGDELLGMGCNKFVEFGPLYEKAMSATGLALNTTRHRHLTVAGGRWFLLAKNQGKTYLSQVTFTDTTQKDLFCGDVWTDN